MWYCLIPLDPCNFEMYQKLWSVTDSFIIWGRGWPFAYFISSFYHGMRGNIETIKYPKFFNNVIKVPNDF